MGFYEGLEVTGALIAFICVFLGGYWIYFKRKHYWVGKSIPSDSPVPLLGNAVGLLTGKLFHETDKELYEKYGRVFGTYAGVNPVIYIADPELLKSILVKDFSSFSTRRVFNAGDPFVDNMVSIVAGDHKWRNIRNTMTPAFTSGRLKKMMPLVSDCAKLSVENFDKYSKNGEPVDCKRIYGCYTLDVIANVAFGTKLDSYNDPDNKFVGHAKKVFGAELSWKLILPLLAPKIARKLGMSFFPMDTMNFFKDTTLEIVKRRQANNEVRNDFLQIMMESLKEDNDTAKNETKKGNADPSINSIDDIKRQPLTMDEFIAQTVLFFLAAYDTTATALTSTTYYFATNPDCQKKALEEVDRIWQNKTAIDFEAFSEAKYIGAAIDEALRLVPPGTRLERTCVKEYQLGNTGVTIPPGMIVEVPVYAIHHDPEFFPEPERFMPERFLDEGKTTIANSYTYLPFGAGPRNCIAMRLALMEVKLCLLHVLKHFEFFPSAKTKIPIEFRNTGVLQPKDVIFHVKRRN